MDTIPKFPIIARSRINGVIYKFTDINVGVVISRGTENELVGHSSNSLITVANRNQWEILNPLQIKAIQLCQ